ncbi:hypothetical protein V8C37DRAFT_9592 [Trichoderma ceciliae]
MTFPSHVHMSGTFHDRVHPGLFRPPVSPSSSTDYLSSSTFATESSSKRKWSRSSVPRMHQAGVHGGLFDGGDAYMDSMAPTSRAYALAGQLHTPMVGSSSDDADMAMGESMYSDSDYRRALGTKRSRDQMDDDSSSGPMQLFSQPELVQSAHPGTWGSFAVATIGGVVGRVWEFCKAGAFKGFYAGGGAAFKMTTAGISVDEAGSTTPGSNFDQAHHFQDHFQGHFQGHYQQQPNRDCLGGGRPRHVQEQLSKRSHYGSGHQNAGYDSSYDSGASTPTGPAPKRRRHTDSGSELAQNWVMIREPSRDSEVRTPRKLPASARASPRHGAQQTPLADHRMGPPSSFSTPASSSPAPLRPVSRAASRPGSRMSDASSLRPARPASAASFASFKAAVSVPKPPTPSRIPVKANTSATIASSAPLSTYEQGRRRRNTVVPSSSEPSAWRGHHRADSAASVATSRANEIDASPRLDAEAKRLATRRQMEERDADVRMAAFNKQLQDMIRQGKEALGSSIDVDVNDGGWEDAL